MAVEMKERSKWAEILDSHWSYIDVLLLALAYLPPGANKLTADAGAWNKVVAELKEQFRNTSASALLAPVHFEYRPPLPPHSDQLDEFFKCTGLSGKLAAVNPAYQVFDLSWETKQIIKERRERKLAPYIDAIRDMSARLQDLVIAEGSGDSEPRAGSAAGGSYQLGS